MSPAWQAAKVDLNQALKQAGRGLTGSSSRLRNALVVAQVALSFALAIGAGLLFRSFLALNSVDLGYRTQGMLVMYAHEPARTLDDYLEAGRFFENAVEQIKQVPGVTSAAAAMGLPECQCGSNGGDWGGRQDRAPHFKKPPPPDYTLPPAPHLLHLGTSPLPAPH